MENTDKKIQQDVVASFVDGERLNQAVKRLLDAGIENKQISLLCTEQSVMDKLQDDFDVVNEANSNEKLERFVAKEGTSSTVAATVGGLSLAATTAGGAAIIASAGVFGGAVAVATATAAVVGSIGALTGVAISQSDADKLQEELDDGHILLVVRTGEDRQKDEVVELLQQCSNENIIQLAA